VLVALSMFSCHLLKAGWMRLPNMQVPKQGGCTISSDHRSTRDKGVEGTVVVEQKCLEFHWQCGVELDKEKFKRENSNELDRRFHELVNEFIAAKKEIGI